MIYEKRKSGLRFWVFFESSAHPLLFCIHAKKFPYLFLSVCNKKNQEWIDL